MSESRLERTASQRSRLRFGSKWLLLVVLLFSVVLAGIAREYHRVGRESRLIGELEQIGVRVRRGEPTAFALLARKLLGRRDIWLTRRLDESWFSRPNHLVTWTATDDEIPELVALIDQLGMVRELHLEEAPVTARGTAVLRRELPGVAVLTRADLLRRRPTVPRLYSGVAAIELLLIGAAALSCLMLVLVWPVLRWRRDRRREAARVASA